jgi:hypothetical protein
MGTDMNLPNQKFNLIYRNRLTIEFGFVNLWNMDITVDYRVMANGVEIDDVLNHHDSIQDAKEYYKSLTKYRNTTYQIVKKTRQVVVFKLD